MLIFCKTIGSSNSLTLIEKNQVFKNAKFEFKVTEHYGLWVKNAQLWPLNKVIWHFSFLQHSKTQAYAYM